MNQTNINLSDEITLKALVLKVREWWQYLVSKWLIILIAGIIGGVIGLVYAKYKDPVYKADLSFALEDEASSGSLSGAAGLASQFGFDLGGGGGGAFSGDNLLLLMKSRSIVEKTLLSTITADGKTETLADLYISFNHIRDAWKGKPALEKISYPVNADRSKFSLQQDSVLGVFYNSIITTDLSVEKLDKKLSIINISVKSKNELFAKYFTEILAKTVSDFYVDTKTRKSVENVNILQHQADSVRARLNEAINGVAYSVDATPNANPERQILRTQTQRKQIDVQADEAILSELVKNLEVSRISLRKETPLIQVIDKPILPLEKDKVGKAKGIVLGAFILAFLTVVYLLIKKLFGNTLN